MNVQPDKIHRGIHRWAYKNAYMLIFLSLLFIITWTIQIVLTVSGG